MLGYGGGKGGDPKTQLLLPALSTPQARYQENPQPQVRTYSLSPTEDPPPKQRGNRQRDGRHLRPQPHGPARAPTDVPLPRDRPLRFRALPRSPVGMPSCLEPRPKPRTTSPRQKYGRLFMTPSARGSGCGPVLRSGGVSVEVVPGPPDQPGDAGGRSAGGPGGEHHGPRDAEGTPLQVPPAADPTDAA